MSHTKEEKWQKDEELEREFMEALREVEIQKQMAVNVISKSMITLMQGIIIIVSILLIVIGAGMSILSVLRLMHDIMITQYFAAVIEGVITLVGVVFCNYGILFFKRVLLYS